MRVETYFSGLSSPTGSKPLGEIIEAIRRDADLRQQIEAIRAERDPKRQGELKKKLPAIQVSAARAEKGRAVIEHSGLLQIDIDGITRERAEQLRDSWEYDPHIVAAFLTPRFGAKGIMQIPANAAAHLESWQAAEAYIRATYGEKIDRSTKDTSRLCFMSHDPCAWLIAEGKTTLDVADWTPAPAPEPIASGEELVPEPEEDLPFAGYHDNDAGRAARFCDRWLDEIRFVPERGAWLTWEGRWMRNGNGGLKRRAIQLADEIIQEAASRPAQTREEIKAKSEAITRAARWGDKRTIDPMLSLSEANAAVHLPVAKMDADHFLIGTPNAVINIRTGEAREHSPADCVTLTTRASFDQYAPAPRWEQFLEEVFPDPEIRRFVWKAAGYSITGCMGEEVFFICHNSGRNGKSKFIGAITHVLGDYADTAGVGLIVANNRGDDPKHEKAKIVGKRFLRAPELEDRQRLNIGTIKDIVGGDPLDAEAKYEHPFTFRPVAKLWIATNHKPDISDVGLAIWERVRLIPFERYFEPHERDPSLESKLQAESSGILNWLIRGALLWQLEGLQPPDKVKAAVAEYQRESDSLADFIAQRTAPDSSATLPHGQLFNAYLDWAREEGIKFTLTSKGLARQLRERGWKARRMPQSFTNWEGITLQP